MKASELMLHDLVMVDGEYKQVTRLDGLRGTIETEATKINKTCVPYSEEDVRPIPLTEEFLILNGYEDDGMYLVNDWSEGNILDKDYKSNYIQLTKWSMDGDLKVFKFGVLLNNVPAISTEVRYVHQLQHALRAIGLADKAIFKVE